MSNTVDLSFGFPAEGISAVHISSCIGDLTVIPSDDAEAHVSCRSVPEGSFAELRGSTLYVEIRRAGVLSAVFKNPFRNASCTVALPDKLYDSFTAEAGMGNSRIAAVSCREAHIETGMGNITIEGFRPAESLRLESGTGNVTAELPQCGKTVVSAGKGNIQLSCCAAGLTVSGGTGDISLSGTVNGEMVLKGGVGNISFDGTVNGDLSVKGGIGNVDLRLHEDPDSAEKHSVKTSHGIGKVNIEYVR